MENYDKQMRLGNTAVDNCSSQGLPDFYFFLSLPLSSLLLSPLLSFSRSAFLLSLARPVRAFLFVASRPPPPRWKEREGGGGGRRRGSHRDSYLLLSLFPLFSSPPAALPSFAARSPSSSAITSLLLLLPLLPLFLSRNTHPLARTATPPPRPFSPSNSSLFLLRCSAPSPPPLRLSPPPGNPDLDRRSCSSSFYPRCSRVLSPFLSFFLSVFLSFLLSAPLALPVVSNFAKGW